MNNNGQAMGFIHEYNMLNRESFNPTLFQRSEKDLIEQLEKVILSVERDKFFTIKVKNFTVIEDYIQIEKLLYEFEEKRNRKNKRVKFNKFDYIDLKDSDIIILKIDYFVSIHESGETEEFSAYISIPKIVNKYYFRLSGNLYCPMYQICDGSTYNNSGSSNKKSSQSVVFKTLYMKTSIYLKKDKFQTYDGQKIPISYYTFNIFKNTIIGMKYFLAKFGIYKCMSFLGIRNVYITQTPYEDDKYYCFYNEKNNNIFISIDKFYFENNIVAQSFVATLIICADNRNLRVADFFEDNFWKIKLGKEYKSDKVEKGEAILVSLEGIYDINTKEVLRLNWEDKKDIYCILRWIMYEFQNLRAKDNTDLSTKRIRLSEYIASLYAMKLSRGLYNVSNPSKISMKKIINALNINYGYLIAEIVRCRIIPYADAVNDNDALTALKFTFKGIAGIGENKPSAVPDKYRFVNASHLGRVDKDSSPNSDPGMNGTICPYAEIYQDGFLSDYMEPSTWRRRLQTMDDEYKKINNVRDLFIAMQTMLGTNERDNIEKVTEDIRAVSNIMSNISVNCIDTTEQIPLEQSGTIYYTEGDDNNV